MNMFLCTALLIFVTFVNAAAKDTGCDQPMKIGPCKALKPRWFFNKAISKCEPFNWGGCQPNKNNFGTLTDCKKACKPSDQLKEVCLEPKKVGPCRSSKPRWHYNQTSEKCELFYWGGCRPNGNNFRTARACKRECQRCRE